MKLCAIESKELEEKILTRFAENQNDELLEDLSDYVINSQKEIERLNKRILTLEETIRRANNNVLKDIAMIKTHEMIKQEIVQRLFETSKMLEKGSD